MAETLPLVAVATSRASAIPTGRLAAKMRWGLFALGLVLATLLVTARLLTPSPTGSGTHMQLGLPPCSTVLYVGLPCPFCGMTTSWAWLTRGDFAHAAEANLGGLFGGLLAMVVCVWTLTSSAIAGWWLIRPTTKLFLSLVAAFLLVTLVDWVHGLLT